MGLSDSLPGRPAVMYSHGALVASASARQGLPGSSADLSTRAVPNHPGRSDGCIRLLLRHRSCLASSKSGGLATFVFLSRPNRVHLRYGSRVRLASPPAPLLELAPARLRVEQAIYTMNSFQFIRSTRLLLAYPTNRTEQATHRAVGNTPLISPPAKAGSPSAEPSLQGSQSRPALSCTKQAAWLLTHSWCGSPDRPRGQEVSVPRRRNVSEPRGVKEWSRPCSLRWDRRPRQ